MTLAEHGQRGFLLRCLALLGVLALAVGSYEAIARPWIRNWGARGDEASRALPGDELVPAAANQATRAITIDAPAATVWGWVAQIGQDRAGFYSFKHLENVLGSEMPDVRTLQPSLQRWQLGDPLWMYPERKQRGAPLVTLQAYEPGHHLGFAGHAAFGSGTGSWTLVVVPDGPDRTRLLVRDRADRQSGFAALLSRELLDPVHFVMELRMLRGIKTLAEGGRISTVGNDALVVLWVLTGLLGVAAAVVALRTRRPRRGLAVLAGCAALFQVLTFVQPHPVLGAIAFAALFVALVVGARDSRPSSLAMPKHATGTSR